MQTFAWPIEDIVAAYPGLYLDHHAAMAVALMSQYAAPPCEFLVECAGFNLPQLGGESKFLLRIDWNEQTALDANRVRRTEQRKPIVEHAAVALAALVFAHFMPREKLRVTEEGDRADYWLAHSRRALEISGTEQSGELPRRQREKTAQVLENPRQWNGYVFVCCFSATRRLIRWSYHVQGD